jgi:hypothetical protein
VYGNGGQLRMTLQTYRWALWPGVTVGVGAA